MATDILLEQNICDMKVYWKDQYKNLCFQFSTSKNTETLVFQKEDGRFVNWKISIESIISIKKNFK